MPLDIGDQAPNFSLPDENGQMQRLVQYRGQNVVVYFYPKDGTPGCTKEACGIRDSFSQFNDNNIVVLGISYDDAASHKKFQDKHNLPFHLLTDGDKSVSKLYGADGMFFPSRKTYLIDKNGILVKIYKQVNVISHAEEILYFFESN
ncbi:MAG: peroxiredoxin [Armatimonadetes bacterium]|nr:peroxiredoxin [Armatimonadota bacterium]